MYQKTRPAQAPETDFPRESETKISTTRLVETFSKLCHRALMAEVSATPKPGLVDRHDSGAHSDMDFDTFSASSDAIAPWITKMFEIGLFWQEDRDGRDLFSAIRPLGVKTEKAMFDATNGINTHKGMIFSMGIVSAIAGFLFAQTHSFNAEAILETSGLLCRDLIETDFQKMDKKNPRGNSLCPFRYKGNPRGGRGGLSRDPQDRSPISAPFLRSRACSAGKKSLYGSLPEWSDRHSLNPRFQHTLECLPPEHPPLADVKRRRHECPDPNKPRNARLREGVCKTYP